MAKSPHHSLIVSDTEESTAITLAKHIADLSHKRTITGATFTVVLSGGYLINSLRKLLESPYIDSIDWSKWHVFWLDERVVRKDHPDSNYKLAFDGFLSKVAIPESQVYGINDMLSPESAADDYEARLKELVNAGVLEVGSSGFPRFDLMLLGMGPDGHVASLFPGHRLLGEKLRWVTFIKDSPKPPPERITFTFPVINAAGYVAMVVVGGGEVDAVGKALGSKDEGIDKLPVQMISLDEGEFVWFCDEEAVVKLQDSVGK